MVLVTYLTDQNIENSSSNLFSILLLMVLIGLTSEKFPSFTLFSTERSWTVFILMSLDLNVFIAELGLYKPSVGWFLWY